MKKFFLVTLIASLALLLTACSTETELNQSDDEQSPVTSLSKYQSSEYGFQFQYPEEWTLDSDSSVENQIVNLTLNESALDNTNVHEASFRVYVQNEESLKTCLAEDLPDPSPIRTEAFSADNSETVNGVTFYVASGVEGVAGTDYESRYKRTYRETQCFTIEEYLTYSNISFYAGTYVKDAVEDIWNQLESIFQSFIFEVYDDIGYGHNEDGTNENMKVGYGTNDRIPAPEGWEILIQGDFTVYAPSGWVLTPEQGIDSYVGTISGDGLTLRYMPTV